MTALALVLVTALMLGALHAFDADHLAVMASFMARRPSQRSAVSFAVRWGLGHSATLMATGLASTLFSLTLSPGIETAAELAVGVMLIGVGLWVLGGLRRGSLLLRPHAHGTREHTHLHRPGHDVRAGVRVEHHSIFWMGALHGLAGSAGLMVIIPIALISSAWAVIGYILVFSLGVTAAMSACALAISGVFGRFADGAGARWYPWLAGAAGCFTLLLGLAWISLTISARAV